MPPEAVEALGAMVGIISIGTFVLIGMKMRLEHRRMLVNQKHQSSGEVDKLAEEILRLSEQNQILQDDVAELQDRIDFHERMLVKGQPLELSDTPV